VVTFGATQGGSIDDNVARWSRQFEANGEPVRSTREVHGMTVTRVEMAGTYHAMRMPAVATAPAAQPGFRLVGEIVAAPSGLWFFKLTGPSATVAAASSEIDSLVNSAHPK
jgi:hypothetical protein